MVVDDDATLVDVVGRYLCRDGHQVECVHDGYAALRRIEEEPPDLVILDLMLPGITVWRSAAGSARTGRSRS